MPKEKSKKVKVSTVPYAKGYHPPTPKEQRKAIGFNKNSPTIEYSDSSEDSSERFFFPVPQPSSIDDWLAQYIEEGQSYSDYLKENPWFSRRKAKFMSQKFVPNGAHICDKYPEGKIYVVKVGNFQESDVKFCDIIDYIQRFLCLPVKVLEGVDIERKEKDLILVEDPAHNPFSRPNSRIKRSTLRTRYNHKTKHIQVAADTVLHRLGLLIPRDALCLIGLTQYDLYGDEPDLFVAGLAEGNRRVAVFSLMRYNPALTFSQEFWFQIKETKNVTEEERKRLTIQRSCKLVVHEICHLLGIDHCIYYRCCMNGSGHLQEDFDQPMMLCPVDLHKLQTLVGFDVSERYQKLLEFFEKHKLGDEASWTRRRLMFLKTTKANEI